MKRDKLRKRPKKEKNPSRFSPQETIVLSNFNIFVVKDINLIFKPQCMTK